MPLQQDPRPSWNGWWEIPAKAFLYGAVAACPGVLVGALYGCLYGLTVGAPLIGTGWGAMRGLCAAFVAGALVGGFGRLFGGPTVPVAPRTIIPFYQTISRLAAIRRTAPLCEPRLNERAPL
jgi:hypothetical protein